MPPPPPEYRVDFYRNKSHSGAPYWFNRGTFNNVSNYNPSRDGVFKPYSFKLINGVTLKLFSDSNYQDLIAHYNSNQSDISTLNIGSFKVCMPNIECFENESSVNNRNNQIYNYMIILLIIIIFFYMCRKLRKNIN